MSDSLLGYHCIGPVTVSDAQIKAAKKRGREVLQLAMDWDAAEVQGDDEFEVPDFWSDLSSVCDIEHLLHMTEEDLDELVDEIVAFWSNPYTCDDASSRQLSDVSKVVFAGGMSYGGEPEGEGYYYMRRMFELDLAPCLGVF